MAGFRFELVSPERLLFSGDVESVVVPGAEGQFMVLKDHAPMMSTLRPGIVEVVDDASKKKRLFVRGCFADVSWTGLTILAEQAVPVEELDLETINQEIRNAEEDVADATNEDVRRHASEKLDQLREVKSVLAM